MSDFGNALQQLSGSAQLVWLAHPYPPGGEVYDFLARPDTLEAIRKVGPKLFLGLDSSYSWIAGNFARGQIGAEQLEQSIEQKQQEAAGQPGSQAPGHVDPVPPASLAKLIINARAAGVELSFIGGSSLYEFDESHMKPWIDSAKEQRSYGSGLIGLLVDGVMGPEGVENTIIANAMNDSTSYLGRAIRDKVGWINRSHLFSANEVLLEAEGQRAVVVFPSEKIDAVHNFDLSLATAAALMNADKRGEPVNPVGPEGLSRFAEEVGRNPPTGLVRRLDLTPSVLSPPASGIEQKLAQETPRQEATPAFSLASGQASNLPEIGQVEVPEWKLANSPPTVNNPTGLIKAAYRPR